MTPEEAIKTLESQGVNTKALIAQLDSEGYDTSPLHEPAGMVTKVWNSLNVPSQMSQQGLSQLTSAGVQGQNALAEKTGLPIGTEPTGNLPADIARNIPKIAAETMTEVAPQFINRASLVTAGALGTARAAKPLIKSAGSLMGKGAEALSGLEHQTPGVLAEAAKDSSLIFSKGREAAADLYKAAKNNSSFNLFDGLYKPDEIVDMARTYIAKGGALEPTEALMYRKAVDKLLKSGKYVKDELFTMRQEADQIAKQSDLIAQADPMYVRGMRAEALRNLLPQNKGGGSSAFKSAIAAAMKSAGIVTLPIVQGVAATGMGLAARGASALAGPTVRSASQMGSLIGAGMGLLSNRDNQ